MHLLERQPRESGRDYALRTIKENIISLELAPGSPVSENELSAAMGLSRTPVREALIELSKVKIVEISPQKRSIVAPIDYNLVEESRFMRNVLECAVAELDCEMAAPEDLERLSENSPPEALMALDDQFHEILFEIAQKTQVYALTRNISIHFDRVRRMSLESVKDLKIVQDHAQILDAIRSRTADRARYLMQTHLGRYRIDAAAIREKYPQYFS